MPPIEAPDVAATAAPAAGGSRPAEIPVVPAAASESQRRRGRARRRRRARRPWPPTRPAAMFRRFRPGQSLDDEIAAYEREQAAAEAEPVDAGAAAGGLAAAAALDAAGDAAERRPRPLEPSIVEATSRRGCRAGRAGRDGRADPPAPSRPRRRVDVLAAAAIIAAVPEPAGRRTPSPTPGPPLRRQPSRSPRRPPPPTAADDIVPQPTWQIVAPDSTRRRARRRPRRPTRPMADRAGVAEPARGRRPAVPESAGHRRPAASSRSGPSRPARSRSPPAAARRDQPASALRQLRAVTVRHRPVLPALRDPPGLTPPRGA